MHVARLHDLSDYVSAAWALMGQHRPESQSSSEPPMSIFLSTDDEAVVRQVEDGRMGASHGYRFNYYYLK